jgi:hypothetical protein
MTKIPRWKINKLNTDELREIDKTLRKIKSEQEKSILEIKSFRYYVTYYKYKRSRMILFLGNVIVLFYSILLVASILTVYINNVKDLWVLSSEPRVFYYWIFLTNESKLGVVSCGLIYFGVFFFIIKNIKLTDSYQLLIDYIITADDIVAVNKKLKKTQVLFGKNEELIRLLYRREYFQSLLCQIIASIICLTTINLTDYTNTLGNCVSIIVLVNFDEIWITYIMNRFYNLRHIHNIHKKKKALSLVMSLRNIDKDLNNP